MTRNLFRQRDDLDQPSRSWQWLWLLWFLPLTFLIALIVYLYVELQRVQHEQTLMALQLEVVHRDKAELRLSSSDLATRHIDYRKNLQDLKLEAEDWKDKTKRREDALNTSRSAVGVCELQVESQTQDSAEYRSSKESTMSSEDGAKRNKTGSSEETQREEQTSDRARRLFLGSCVDTEGKCNKDNVFQYCGAWKVTEGNCQLDFTKNDCLSSPNFPDNYPHEDYCKVTINKEKTRPFFAQVWSVGEGDTLTLDGVEYTKEKTLTFAGPAKFLSQGTSQGSVNFVPEYMLEWSSDGEVNFIGWKICALQKPANKAGPITLAKEQCGDPSNSNPGCCVLTDGDTCAKSRTQSEANDQCSLMISGRQTLNFETFDGVGGGGVPCDVPNTAYGNYWWPNTAATALSRGDCCHILRYKEDDVEQVLLENTASCKKDNFDVADVHGQIQWFARFTPLKSSTADGWKFCVNVEDESYKQPEVCERTCGGCIADYKEQLLNECIDDVWFVEGCLHFAKPGAGFTSDALSQNGEKCTQVSADSALSSWNGDKSTSISVDIPFVRRLRLHCPLSCGICTQCVQGKYRDQSVALPNAADACKDCPIGLYQDFIHQYECKACAVGKYQDSTGSSECKSCPAGRYSAGTSAVGNGCGDAGIPECTLCPAGRVQADAGKTACVDCLPGKSQPTEGQGECLSCTAGKYESGVAAANCTLCEPGKVGDDVGAVSCSDCFPGTHQDVAGTTACKKCGVGRYGTEIGISECIKCPAGKFQDELASFECIACGAGRYSSLTGSSDCEICPAGLTTLYPGQSAITGCVCSAGTYGLQGSGEDTCAECPGGFSCPGGHSYSDSSIDQTPMLLPAYMSLPGEPYKAFICQGTRMICEGLRKPFYVSGRRLTTADDWLQVCAGGRIGQGCADCPLNMYKNSEGCDDCNDFDKVLFWFAMPCFFAVMVALHNFWSRPSSKEQSDFKIAVVGFNLYLLYCQILGVFQTVLINWASPFKEFLELTSYMRLRTDFLKPSCGVTFNPTRDYITRGLMPLAGMLGLCSVYVICQCALKVYPDAKNILPPAVCQWMYFVNTIGSIYMLFSSGLSLTAFLPHQCQSNPGGLSNIEWPAVLCTFDDPDYVNMTLFSIFAVLIYVAFFPALCAWQVLSHSVSSATDPHFFVKYKFLFQNYSAEARYWALIMMLRNVCLAIALAFLQQDTFFQVTCMTFIMVIYLTLTCLCWPWSLYQINYLDIVGCIGLSFIMSVGTGFIEADVNQGSLLVLLSLVFGAFIAIFVASILYYLFSFAAGRYDFTIFLSHAKFNGGAVARLFKIQLGHRLASSEKIFLDSDNLVSLHELHVFVQHTRNLTLLLTPECYAREWVAVEIVTSFLHDVHVILISINNGLAPDEAFIPMIPNVFRSCLEGRFPAMGITEALLQSAYTWLSKKEIKLGFDVYSASGRQNHFFNELIPELSVGKTSQLKILLDGTSFMQSFKVRSPKGKDDGKNDSSAPTFLDTTRIFLCREKTVDVQQEASCICLKITLSLLLDGDVYMATADTEFKANIRIIEKLPSQGLILMCLTRTVLKCLDTVAMISAGVLHDLFIIPVQIDTDFAYPGDAFYESFQRGEVLDLGNMLVEENVYRALTKVLQTIFMEISIPFNANASETAIKSSGKGVMDRYNLCQQDTAGVVGMIMSRLKDYEKRALDAWVARRKDEIEELPAMRAPNRASMRTSRSSPPFSPGFPALSDTPRAVARKGAKSDAERGNLDGDDEDNEGSHKAPKRRAKLKKLRESQTMPEKSPKGDYISTYGTRKKIDDADDNAAAVSAKPTLKTYMERKTRQRGDDSADLGQSLPTGSNKSKGTAIADNGLEESVRGEQRPPRQAFTNQKLLPRDRPRNEEDFGEGSMIRSRQPSANHRSASGEDSGANRAPPRAKTRRIESREGPSARRPFSGSEETVALTDQRSTQATASSDQPYRPNPRPVNSLPTVEPVIQPPAPGKSRLARW